MTNWVGTIIAIVLLVIVPIWVIPLVDIPLGTKLFFTIGGAIATYFLVEMRSTR